MHGLARDRPRLHVTEEDFVVYETEYQTSCATVLLLDMSGSMARYGKFYHAKKVALALLGTDPRPLSRGHAEDHRLLHLRLAADRTRVCSRRGPSRSASSIAGCSCASPLDNPPEFVPEHFTNIQAGLRFARHYLRRHPAANKQIICVTDGEPTAHLEGGDLVLMYPPSERTARATLEEVHACQQGSA